TPHRSAMRGCRLPPRRAAQLSNSLAPPKGLRLHMKVCVRAAAVAAAPRNAKLFNTLRGRERDAQSGRKRIVHADRPGKADGRGVAPLLASGRMLGAGDEEAAAGEGARRGARALSRRKRRAGADAAALRPSLARARLWPGRGRQLALPLSWLAL